MANRNRATTLGAVLRQRRRQLDITQQQVARRVGVRANYIGYLERNMRHPSTSVLAKLARVLDLDREELFFLANPRARDFIRTEVSDPKQTVWQEFRGNKRLLSRHGISTAELKVLEQASALGSVHSSRDYLFILQVIRQALQA